MSKTHNAGIVTAYGAAVRGGYTGTYEEFCAQQAQYAENARDMEQAVNDVRQIKTSVESAVSEAEGYANNANQSATNASNSATQASESASNANQSAESASQFANNASNSANNASQSATSAQTSANNAGTSEQNARQSAETAQDVLDSVQTEGDTQIGRVQAKGQEVLDSIPEDFTQVQKDIASLNESLGDVKADLADVDNHTVKSAEQLISDKRTVDKVPYKYRASQSGKSDRAYDTIVGGTVCFNQLSQNGDFSNGTNGWSTKGTEYGTLNASDGICTYTIGSAQSNLHYIARSVNIISEHVYACIASINPSKQTSCRFLISWAANGSVSKVFTANTWGKLETIVKTKQALQYATIYVNTESDLQENDTVAFKHIMFMDLTAMFGTTIADYIYSLEQATAGAGVSLFKQMFPNEYYPYNAGGLVSVEGLSAHVMRDADDNIVGLYPLDSSLTLRGVPVLKDGKVEFDGDTYEADGTVTRRYGIVDLGTLTWSRTTSYTNAVLYASVPSKKVGDTISAICAKYVMSGTYSSAQGFSASDDKTFGLGRLNAQIFVRDDSFTDPTAFKSAMSGVYLVYELATPTTEEATPYTSPQIVSPYGTEEYISESVCPVGHVTEYPDNLRAKIDGLPWDLSMIAPVEVTYTATRNYTVNQLLIVDNTLYKVTANIANNGTITPNSNVVATTLSEVIASLS